MLVLRFYRLFFLPSILSQIIYFSAEKDEITDDKVKRESGDSDGSDSDSDDDADVSKVCMISRVCFLSTANL